MKKKYSFLLTSIILLLILPFNAQASRGIKSTFLTPSGDISKGTQWLFVIGIDSYKSWPKLDTAASDARSVKKVLLNRYHFNKDHLVELYDEEATRKNILRSFRELAKKVKKDDSLVIYYAGHGHIDSITRTGSWIPVESDVEDSSSWISNYEIKNYLRVDVIRARHILLVSDSCFSGDFFRGRRGKLPVVTDKGISRAYELTSRNAITSGGLEPVSDAGFGKNSVFTHFFVKSLQDNQKPFLIPSDLFPEVKAGVIENAEQLPRFGSLKDSGGQQGGELVFFLKKNSALDDMAEKSSSLKKKLLLLQKLEKENLSKVKEEKDEIRRHEQEISRLSEQIALIEKKSGYSDSDREELDKILEYARKRDLREKELEELRKKRREEELRRVEKIARIKREREALINKNFRKDYIKYEEILNSNIDKSLKKQALGILKNKYSDFTKRREKLFSDRKGEKRREAESNPSKYNKLSMSIQYQKMDEDNSGVGFGLYHCKPYNLGLYFNLLLNTPDTEKTPEEGSVYDPMNGGYESDRLNEFTAINFGVTKHLFYGVFGYTGIGWVEEKEIVEVTNYGIQNYYYDDDKEDTSLNLNAGVIVHLNRLVLEAGYYTYNRKFVFGGGFSF